MSKAIHSSTQVPSAPFDGKECEAVAPESGAAVIDSAPHTSEQIRQAHDGEAPHSIEKYFDPKFFEEKVQVVSEVIEQIRQAEKPTPGKEELAHSPNQHSADEVPQAPRDFRHP